MKNKTGEKRTRKEQKTSFTAFGKSVMLLFYAHACAALDKHAGTPALLAPSTHRIHTTLKIIQGQSRALLPRS